MTDLRPICTRNQNQNQYPNTPKPNYRAFAICFMGFCENDETSKGYEKNLTKEDNFVVERWI